MEVRQSRLSAENLLSVPGRKENSYNKQNDLLREKVRRWWQKNNNNLQKQPELHPLEYE